MALIDLYRRYMYGQAPGMSVDTGDAPATGMATSGLFGTSGEPGRGGLLTTFDRPDSSGLLDVFSNPFVTIGLSGLQRGMAGQDISQAALPAVTEGFRTSSVVGKIQQDKKKKEFIKKYADQVPEEDKEMFMAFPEKYVSAMLQKRLTPGTLSKEALALYRQAKNIPADQFSEWFDSLPKAQQDLYNKQIRGNLSNMEATNQLIKEFEKEKQKQAIDVPMVDGQIDANKLMDGITYNLNGQIVIWNAKQNRFEKPGQR